MSERVVIQRDFDYVLLGNVSSLRYGSLNVGAFTHTNANFAFVVTKDNQSLETETAATLNNAGYAVNVYNALVVLLLFKRLVGLMPWVTGSSIFSHIKTPILRREQHLLTP